MAEARPGRIPEPVLAGRGFLGMPPHLKPSIEISY
jgi:hypothetical protein